MHLLWPNFGYLDAFWRRVSWFLARGALGSKVVASKKHAQSGTRSRSRGEKLSALMSSSDRQLFDTRPYHMTDSTNSFSSRACRCEVLFAAIHSAPRAPIALRRF